MRKILFILVVPVLLLASGVARGLSISGSLKAAPYTLVQLAAADVPEGAAVIWDVSPDDAVDSREAGGVLTFVAPPGTYKVKLRTIKGSSVACVRAVVVIGTPAPVPPGPGPGPVPPGPADPLAAALQALYAADATPSKAKDVASLAALYRQAVATAADPKLTTAGALLSTIKAAATSMLPPGSLAALRVRLGSELAAVLPTAGSAPLTPDVRSQAATAFGRIAGALEAVKP